MGFTMVELVVVLMLVGVLGAVALPRMQGLLSFRDDAWRDGLLDAMRYAQKTAVSHRRLVCMTVADRQVTLQMATANPATSCNATLAGPAGGSVFATSANTNMLTSVAPSGVIFFQPDGRSTTDGAGTTPTNRIISPSGLTPLSLIGETGHAE